MKDDAARISHIKLSNMLDRQENNIEDPLKGFAKKPPIKDASQQELTSLRLMKLIRENMRIE